MAIFGLRKSSSGTDYTHLFYSDNDQDNRSEKFGLCPLVSLKSNLFTGTKDSSGAWNLQ